MNRASFLLFGMLLSTQAMPAATVTIESLPASAKTGNPVCHNKDGALSRCADNPIANATLVNLSPVAEDTNGVAVGTFLGFFALNIAYHQLMTEQGYIFTVNSVNGQILRYTPAHFYTTANCSGQAYVEADLGDVQPGFLFTGQAPTATLPIYHIAADAKVEQQVLSSQGSGAICILIPPSIPPGLTTDVYPIHLNQPGVTGVPMMDTSQTIPNTPLRLTRP